MFTNGNFNAGNSGARDGDTAYNTGSAGLHATTPISNKDDGRALNDPTNHADSNSFTGSTASKPAFIGEG